MSLRGVLYVCVAASLFPAFFASKPKMSRHQLELKEHYEHLAQIAEFHCDLPQPRLLSVNDLFPESQIRGKAYFPEVTVLHRCDRHTGSCNDGGHKCGPTLATTVKMPFKVTFLEAMEDHARGEWTMEYHSLENHTTCGCLKYEVPPSKTKVHYHYIDPSLMPQNFLPLDPDQNTTPGNASSYDVPVYPNSTQSEPDSKHEQDSGNSGSPSYENRPSIYNMTTLAEESVNLKPEDQVKPNPEDEVRPNTDESQYQGYGGFSSDSSTSTTSKIPVDGCDGDSTTIPSDLLRFGNEDNPRSEALRSVDIDSPYDAYLNQAFS